MLILGFSYDKVTNMTENQTVKNNKTDTNIANVSLWNYLETYTVKSAHDVACIKRSPFSSPVIEKFIWIEPLLRGHLSLKNTYALSQMWPLNTGLTVLVILSIVL